ncbi:hypothetical protein IU11_00390 [Cellulosimicrobium sp. MM]|nr:hypothetical protein IU11_00390 [Cellulosimicrobium sp. MM]
MLGELVRRRERVGAPGDEEDRYVEVREVLGPQPLGLARRVQRVADEGQPGGGSPSATAIEHMRPPYERPPSTRWSVVVPSSAANASASARTCAIATGGRSGIRLPAIR